MYSCPVPFPLPFPASSFPCLLPHLFLNTQLRWHLLQQAFSTPSGWCSSYKPHHTLRSPSHKAHYCVKSIKLSIGVAPPSQVSCLYCNLPLPNPFPIPADYQLPKFFSQGKNDIEMKSCHFRGWKLYLSLRAAITNDLICGLNNRHLLSCSSGGQKFKIKVSSGLVPLAGSECEPIPGLSLSSWRWPAVLGAHWRMSTSITQPSPITLSLL